MAPFVGLLQACVQQGATRPIRLVYADKHAGQMVDVATLANTQTLQDYVYLSVLEQASEPNHLKAAPCNGATQYEVPAHIGRLDTAGLSAILAHPHIAPLVAEAHFMLCGPNGMMDQAET
ncbi:hypothetical protein RZS08_44990, partial [Arthrospira platensis SPKY1]|nr:hypothetical protein [Arthrospira platensis SPKY1]